MTWPLDELEADKGDTSLVGPFDDETIINTLKCRVPRLASSRLPRHLPQTSDLCHSISIYHLSIASTIIIYQLHSIVFTIDKCLHERDRLD